jgi:hypothetical protein
MSTSPADLLEALEHAATQLPEHPGSRADAGAALGHLGRALTHLKVDGISTEVGDDRERHVATTGMLCTGLAARAPIIEGRLAALAGAAADTIAVLRHETTIPARWAITVEIIDAVATVADVIERGSGATPAAAWIEEIQSQTLWVQREAARHPPSYRGSIVLDRALPETGNLQSLDAATAITAATAALVHATRTTAQALPIAAVLAVSAACQTLSTTAHQLHVAPNDFATNNSAPGGLVAAGLYASGRAAAGSGAFAGAAQAWQAIRASLRPFHDASTRPLGTLARMPPATVQSAVPGSPITAARRLHELLVQVAHDPTGPNSATVDAIVSATQHLPLIARAIKQHVTSWHENASVMSFACDLPLRETRLSHHVAGHRFDGMIHADRFDLAPVTAAARNADLLSTALAAHVARATNIRTHTESRTAARDTVDTLDMRGDATSVASPANDASWAGSGTRHLAAAHQSDIATAGTPERLVSAQHNVYAQLQQAQRTNGHRRSR